MGIFQGICGSPHHWVRYGKQHNLTRGVFGLKEALGANGMAGGKKGKPGNAFLCGVGAVFSDILRSWFGRLFLWSSRR